MMLDGMIIMCILMGIGILFLVVIIGATVYVVTRLLMRNSKLNDVPLMLLKERYVKGEINEEEYKQKQKTLLN